MKSYILFWGLLFFAQFSQATSGWEAFEGTFKISRYTDCDSSIPGGGTNDPFCYHNGVQKWKGVEFNDLDTVQIVTKPIPHAIFRDRSGASWSTESLGCTQWSCYVSTNPKDPYIKFHFKTPEGEFYFTSYGSDLNSVDIYRIPVDWASSGYADINYLFRYRKGKQPIPQKIWPPMYRVNYCGREICFEALNGFRQSLLPSAYTTMRKPSRHSTERPMAWNGDQYIDVPELTTALMIGNADEEYYAVSQRAFYFKANQSSGWNKIEGFPKEIVNLEYPRFFLDAKNKILVFVGYDERTPINSYGKNKLFVWNIETGEWNQKVIGLGFEGMSGIVVIPEKKVILIAAIDQKDWVLNLKSYDFRGNLVADYPQINQYFVSKNLSYGWSSKWRFGVDLGLDTKTQEILVQFGHNDSISDLAKAKIYRVNVQLDQAVGEENP